MNTCTFFGHADSPASIKPHLKSTIIDLIENQNTEVFYVGNHGNFDNLVKTVLTELKVLYHQIKFSICLAYLPRNNDLDYSNTIYPEGLEAVPKRLAIIRRNQWMIEQSHFVVIYMEYTCSNTAKIAEIAEKKCKNIIYLNKTL